MSQGMRDMIAAMAAGEPGWIASIDHLAVALLAGHGPQASAILAVVLDVVAAGVFLPPRAARVTLILAAAVALAIWVVGENFGGIFTGSATDPNSGLMLALLAAAYWPAGKAVPAAAAGVPAAPARPERPERAARGGAGGAGGVKSAHGPWRCRARPPSPRRCARRQR